MSTTPILTAFLLLLTITTHEQPNPWPTIGSIPTPAGFHRPALDGNPFGDWLRRIPLKKDRTVYLFDGRRKPYQQAQFAVLDVSVGKADLQQCADAVMRLRSEFLYGIHNYAAIDFYTETGVRLNYAQWTRQHPDTRAGFDNYLTKVFTYCSTRSLEKQLLPRPLPALQCGDVLVKGGGHAMLVVDIAVDGHGHTCYLLCQSYMPAQDIHIVINPADPAISPWYRADQAGNILETPEWTFTTNQLRTWPAKITPL